MSTALGKPRPLRRYLEPDAPGGLIIAPMYIIAIAWLYVVLMMSLTETSFVAGLMTLCFYGLAPLTLLLWLLGTPARRRRRRLAESMDVTGEKLADQPDRRHPGEDQ